MTKIDTTNIVLDFGRYKGERIQCIPVGYLNFIVDNLHPGNHWIPVAKAELERRGTTMPKKGDENADK